MQKNSLTSSSFPSRPLSFILLIKSALALFALYKLNPFICSGTRLHQFISSLILINYAVGTWMSRSLHLAGCLFGCLICGGLVVVVGGPFDWNSLVLGGLLASYMATPLHFHLQLFPFQPRFAQLTEQFDFLLKPTDALTLQLISSSLGAMVGGSIAGLATALDWNAPWQHFPVPNVMGVVLGDSIGQLVAVLLVGISSCIHHPQQSKKIN